MSFDFPYISNPGGKSVLNGLDIKNIKDLDDAFEVIRKLLNFVETLNQEIPELKRQKQDLRDEINRLKGEQGKPKIKPNKKTPSQYSYEKERKKTRAKKPSMLIVLDHPEIPLHNNPAELGARKRVRKRVVSFGTRTKDGTNAWDTFMSISATAKKLGVNFYHYLSDRISCVFEIPSIA